MMEDNQFKLKPESDLSKKMTDVPPTTIPLSKPVTAPNQKPDIYKANSLLWQQKSELLLGDYKYGWNLGKYSDNKELNPFHYFKRLASAIISQINNEMQKEGRSSEKFMSHFAILNATMDLIARDIDECKLKDFNTQSLLASLQGFIDSYIVTKIKGDD